MEKSFNNLKKKSMELTIRKVLNASVVLCVDNLENEFIVLGKGIGYGKKSGTKINYDDVNQIFVPVVSPEIRDIEKTLIDIPPKIVEITRRIVQKAQKEIKVNLNRSLTISLMDHINFCINRYREGIIFKNKLYWDVQSYYPLEFKVGKWAVALINKEECVELPREEAASIAFHIINSETSDEYKDSMTVTKLVNSLMSIINLSSKAKLDPESIGYQRMLTHIKFFAQRILRGKQLNDNDELMYNHIINMYPEATKIAIKILGFLEKQYRIKITNEELMYLVIHIHRNMS